jgi:hypothetical protein
MAQLQKGQSYPELGFRVDNKGIAYDLTTGDSLAKATVDQRLQGTGTTQLAKQRGGIAGIYDRNKSVIPIAQTALAMLPGIGPLASAGMGALRGFDTPGQSGVSYNAGTGLQGAATGYAAGAAGDMLGKAVGIGQTLGGGTPSTAGTPGTIPTAPANPAGTGGLGGILGSLPGLGSLGGAASGIAGLLGGNNGLNALIAAQGVNAAALGKKSGDYADNAMKTQNDLWNQRAGLRSAGIAGMTAAPTKLPQLGAIAAGGNPFASRTV